MKCWSCGDKATHESLSENEGVCCTCWGDCAEGCALEYYAQEKIKVRVIFASGKSKWGWVHNYQDRWYLTRGNRVGYSLDTAVKIVEIGVK